MSTNWGLALDAELAYRHERIRSDFRRPWWRSARRARHAGAPATPPLSTAAEVGLTTTSLRAVETPAQVVGLTARNQQGSEGQTVRAA